MTDHKRVTRITIDLARNVLLLHLDGVEIPDLVEEDIDQQALIDVGANGRLLGVELGERYFPVADPEPETTHLVRTCGAKVSVLGGDAAIVVPRRGDAYELSFPSGNQCWTRASGKPGDGVDRLCSTVMTRQC